MSAIRRFAKSCIVLALGSERRPRTILRGLAAGYRICVSPLKDLSYILGTAEPHLQRAIRDFVQAGDTVYDIGANIGYVSLSLSKHVGVHGRVISFEPIPRNAEYFRQNIANNQINNVRLLEVAASESVGEATIRLTENFSTASIVWHRDDPSATEIRIRTVAIDGLVETGDLPPPKFVKIDVEGAEGLALKGMRRTVASAKPVIFIECSESGRETSWRLLRESGYTCHRAVDRRPVDKFEDYSHSDFLWLPPHLPSK
jgi:FkbM family methyltransferase